MQPAPNFEDMIAMLEGSEQYRVLRRLPHITEYSAPDASEKHIGLYLDGETTGLNPREHKLIELSIVAFEFSSDGKIYRIIEDGDWFEDPGHPLTAEISNLTGISDDDVRGKSFPESDIKTLAERAVLVIAHNADFDREFVERRFPGIFEQKFWADSMGDVPWKSDGHRSQRLEHLLLHYGFFYKAHRANIDCRAGIHLLTQTLASANATGFELLLGKARSRTTRIFAHDAPFEKKGALYDRGYVWSKGENGRPKAWWREVDANTTDEEIAWLWANVMTSGRISCLTINGRDRYSPRAWAPGAFQSRPRPAAPLPQAPPPVPAITPSIVEPRLI